MIFVQVENLEPPYGLCGEIPLSYYDGSKYSIAKCKMQLETDYVDKECGCRDFHQPHYSSGTKLLEFRNKSKLAFR